MPRSLGVGAAVSALLCLFVVAATPAAASVLTGRILDHDTGEPLAFASVVIRSDTHQTGVIADEKGR